ncbi:MAG: protein kinase [Acidobacteriota bacterium]|nr:protein kinase [Acidobacteriota bacterium]
MNPPTTEIQLTLEDIFHTVCDLPPHRREAYLDDVCAGNDELRRQVENLLRHHEADSGFLETPAVEDAFKEIASTEKQTEEPRQPMIGRQIGNYQILALLGKGGMGEVFLARDTDWKVEVAIKFLPEAYATDPEWQARFSREGRLNAELTHENVAALRHKGEVDGRPFLVFEYVPGETLESKLDKGPLPVAEAMHIFRQLAAALAHAHSRNIIHRDLKPSNIKITPEGQLKVLDFGIAKRITTDLTTLTVPVASPADQLTLDYGETRKGEVIGTIAYMSPEQTRGEMLDGRTDIWSFGCVMYEALTGHKPFSGVDRYDTLTLIRDQKHDPDWSALPTDLPKPVQRSLRQCFAKNRERRLNSITAFVETIDQQLNVVAKRWKRVALVTSAILSVTTAILLWLWASQPPPSPTYVAVMPFSENGEALKIGEGLAKSLRDSLATIPNLAVLPYSGTGEARLADLNPDGLIKAMGVGWLLSGDVQHNGDEVEVRFRIHGTRNQAPLEASVKGSRQNYSELLSALTNRASSLLKVVAPQNTKIGFRDEEKYLTAIALLQSDLTESLADQAIKLLEELAQSEQEPARAHAILARAYLRKAALSGQDRRGWVSKAEKASEEATKLAPDLHEVKVTRGIMKAFDDQNDEAISILKEAWQQNPDDSVAALELARTYEESKQDAEAERTYKDIIAKWPGYWLSHYELSYFYFYRGRFAAAQDEIKKVLLITPNNQAGWGHLGNIQIELGNYQQSEQTFRYLLDSQKDLSTTEQASNWLAIGSAQIFQQRYVEAVDSLNRALELDKESQDPILWAYLGDALSEIGGEAKAAYNAYTKAIQIRRANALSPTGLARLAELYAKRSKSEVAAPDHTAKDKQTATDTVQQVIKLQSEKTSLKSDAFYAIIKTYVFLDDEQKAIGFVDGALKAGVGSARFENDPQLNRMRLNVDYQQIMTRFKQQQ